MCEECGTQFGLYYCEICKLYDDIDKDQYHCDKCGICRVGKTESYHCNSCNICLNKNTTDHKCMDMKSYGCPICMDDLFQSTLPIIKMKCEHFIHQSCLIEMLKTSYKCPYCSMSVIDMEYVNNIIENEVVNTPMPEEMKDMKAKILCNECHETDEVKFHVIGMKCPSCGSYNTRQI